MATILNRLGTSFTEVPLEVSPYVKPKSMKYELDGKLRRWDVVESLPSVGVVIFNRDLQSFVIVRQFRPAVYGNYLRQTRAIGEPDPDRVLGFTFELCAGLIDKAKSMVGIVREEILEECGYDVSEESIREISMAIASSGTSGAHHTIFYTEVRESQRVESGGGLQATGEAIEVLSLPLARCQDFVLDSSQPKSAGLMFGITWAYFTLLGGGQPAPGSDLETGPLTLASVLPA